MMGSEDISNAAHRQDLEFGPIDRARLTEDQWCSSRVCVGESPIVRGEGEARYIVECASTEPSAPRPSGRVALLNGGECHGSAGQSKGCECEDGVHCGLSGVYSLSLEF